MKTKASRLQPAAAAALFLLLVLAALGSPIQQATLNGSATYRERMMLPPGAVFEVTLEETSRADAPIVEIARVRLDKSGLPPFRFSIPYDRARLKPEGSYTVRARILVDGKLIFTGAEAYPAPARGGTPGNTVSITMQRAISTFEGMFRYMADAAIFTDCQTGQRYPVAMESGYLALESAYTSTRRQPGEELKVHLQGQLVMRPRVEGEGQQFQLIVDRYLAIWPGETCGATAPAPPLQGTYWKLTRLQGKPVLLAEGQTEPNLTFNAADNRFAGSTGCNSLTGTYRLNGNNLNLSSIAVTKMACAQGMELESELFTSLGTVARWRVAGQHLELLDGESVVAARFEARPK
ncbi:MAG TPA: META domain-containing protein [Terriglobia bacterium]|nr:META domain-containing protein [Terriglobia bacterium]